MLKLLIKTALSFLIYAVAHEIVYGQSYGPEISSVSIKEGMSQNTVTAMIQDEKGFLWIGTNDGLNKYDGHSFKIFTSSKHNKKSLSSNLIKSLALDQDNNLWIGTQAGLTKYDSKSGIFNRFLANSTKEKSDEAFIVNDLLIEQNSIWIGTDKGLIYVEEASNPVFDHLTSVADNASEFFAINDLVIDEQGNIWAASDHGVYYVDQHTHNGYELKTENGLDLSGEFQCLGFFDNRIWLATDRGLLSFDPKATTLIEDSRLIVAQDVNVYQMPAADLSVQKIFRDDENIVWIGTEANGVFTLDISTGKLEPFVASFEDNSNVFLTTNVTEIFEDSSHNIWIGTLETGVFKVRRSLKKFGLLKSMAGDSNGLSSNRIRGLVESGDYLWIGTAHGLNRYNRKTLTCKTFEYGGADIGSISSNDVKTMDLDQNGNLWIATNNGLNKLNTSTLNFQRFYAGSNKNSLVLDDKVRAVKLLTNGKLWVGTLGGGITVIDPISDKLLRSFTNDPSNDSSLSDNNVLDIFESSAGSIWVATYGGGLNKLNDDGETFTRIKGKGRGRISTLLSSIHEDPDGFLWVGSYGDGLFRINPHDFSFKTYTKETGLSNNVIYAAIPHKNSIWISTNNGLNKYNRLLRNISKYNAIDGLQSNEFNSGSYLKSESGELFFGGVNGLTFFYPDSIRSNKLPPQLAFTDFKIFNKSVMPDEVVVKGDPPLTSLVSDSGRISLSHHHNVFTVEFAALDYTSPEDTRYAYQLTGFDKDWIYSDSKQRAITYTNLKPGKYTFRMKAANDDGVWNEQPILLFIEIAPALWQRWWFKGLFLFIITSLAVTFVYRKITKTERRRKYLESEIKKHTREIYKQNEILLNSENNLKAINKKKDQMFYALAHHVRGPLTSLFSLMKYTNESEDLIGKVKREEYIKQLNEKVGHSLLLLDNTYYWSLMEFDEIDMKKENVNIGHLAKQCVDRHRMAASSKDISVNIEAETDYYVQCDKNMTAIIIQNLITNAIKYSHKGDSISVRFVKESTKIKLVVEDNGVGLDDAELRHLFDENRSISAVGTQNEKGSGLGLQLSNRMAKKMEFDLFADCQKSCTRFHLDMPRLEEERPNIPTPDKVPEY